jgi:hypothetical protein
MSVRPRPTLRLFSVAALALLLSAFTAGPVAAVSARYPKNEQYALRLVNCVRTGGWVRPNGKCIDYGTGKHAKYRKPLKFREHLASDIARPQARRLARAGYLSHNLGGSVSTRFKRAGITCCQYGENLGHYVKPVSKAVAAIHRMMQSEASYNGPHWKNFRDRRYKYVGIGIWTRGDDVYVAYDFWDGKTHW